MRRQRGFRQRGASALELSMLAPVVLLVIYSIIQAALYMYAASVLQRSAEYGTSQIRVNQSLDRPVEGIETVREHTVTYAKSLGGNQVNNVTAEVGVNKEDRTATVTVRGNSISLTGIPLKITKTVTAPVELFTPDCIPGAPAPDGCG